MRILIGKLLVLVLLISFYCFPPDQHAAGDFFGFERLKAFMKANAGLPADEFADAFINHLFSWSGKRSEKALDDDLTLIVADYQHG